MKIALLADVHGNPWALDAVLEDLEHEHPDLSLFLGDAVGLLPIAGATIARLRRLRGPGALGNGDERLLTALDNPAAAIEQFERRLHKEGYSDSARREAVAWARRIWDSLEAEDVAYLRRLQPVVEIPLDKDHTLLGFHATPASNLMLINAATPPAELDRVLDGHSALVMACGHFHCPMLRPHRGSTLVNPGSVGQAAREQALEHRDPYPAAPVAEYALLEYAGGRLRIDYRRVPYDMDALVREIKASGAPAPFPRDLLLDIYDTASR